MKRFFAMVLTLACATQVMCASANDSALLKVDGIGDFAPRVLLRQTIGTGCTPIGAKGPDLFAISNKFYKFECLRYSFKGYDDGVPVFQLKSAVTMPVAKFSYSCYFTELDGKSAVFWIDGNWLKYAFLDDATSVFTLAGKLSLPIFDGGISAFAVKVDKKGAVKVYGFSRTQKNERPGDWRSADFRPYDATGVYMGTLAKCRMCRFEYSSLEDKTVPQIELLDDMPGSHTTPCFVNISGHKGIVSCNHLGGIYFSEEMNDGSIVRHRICDAAGNAIRNLTCAAQPCTFPSKDGKPSLIVTGEGSIQFLDFEKRAANGNLVFKTPTALKEKNPPLAGGSLVVPTSVDWDHDGVLDIVYGNSAGNIMLYRNYGTNKEPRFHSPEFLTAGGERIHVQPGYGEDIQGPTESRWGYVGPNVFDWNGDGIPDILTNDSRGKHNVYIGTANGLRPEHPLYLEDLPLHGMWRCRPGVGVLNGRTVYITLDDQDEFHLYFREDDYNLLDGGKLHLSDGRSIRANFLEAGGKGRLRFEIVDWDCDGVKDLLLSTNMHNMVPADDPNGLPWSHPKELKGSTILFMRNAGTEAAPSYEFPRQLKYDGKLIRLGHHACGACATQLGPANKGGKPNILAADECGNFYLFQRSRISW